MKLDSRRILAASILTFVLLFIFTMLFDWRFNYAEFPRDVVLGLLVLACVVLAFLTVHSSGKKQVGAAHGRPSPQASGLFSLTFT